MDYKKIFKRETKTMAYVIISLTLVVIVASYAMFLRVDNNSNNQVVETGSLVIQYLNSNGDAISNNDAITKDACLEPMTEDEAEAMPDCTYYLNIFNSGSLPASYQLIVYNNAAELPAGSTFVNHDLIMLKVKSKTSAQQEYTPISSELKPLSLLDHSNDTQFKTAQNEIKYVLHYGTLEAGQDVSYSIQAWIDEDLASKGQKLTQQYVYLKLEVIGVVNGDTSITEDETSGQVVTGT